MVKSNAIQRLPVLNQSAIRTILNNSTILPRFVTSYNYCLCVRPINKGGVYTYVLYNWYSKYFEYIIYK